MIFKVVAKNALYIGICFLFNLLIVFPLLSWGEEERYSKIGDVSVPESMETVKAGDVNILVPKGSRLKQESSFLVKEVPDEYASRKFTDVESYLDEIRSELEEQKRELKELRELVQRMARDREEKRMQEAQQTEPQEAP